MPPACASCHMPLLVAGPTATSDLPSNESSYCSPECRSLGKGGVGAILTPQVGVGILVAAQSMVLSLAINLSPPDSSTLRVLQWIVLVANLGVAIMLGAPLVGSAFNSLVAGQIRIEFLFLSGIIGALGISIQSMQRGSGPIYAEVVAVLLVVYTLGKSVAAKSRVDALSATKLWTDIPPQCRRVDDSGKTALVDLATIRPGDVVAVFPGEVLPIDGVVIQGSAYVRESMFTGEASPVIKHPGAFVWAGTCCEDADLWIRCEFAENRRRIDWLIDAVDQARNKPGTLQRQADRLATVFVPVVSVVALATFAGWTWHSGLDSGLFHALSVLLVACPCGFGLATPAILWSALGRLAKHGLVTRDGDLIERLAQVDTVCIDKTGTLTESRLSMIDLTTFEDMPITRYQLSSWLAALGRDDPHPVLRSFMDIAEIPEDLDIIRRRVEPGRGVEALIRQGLADRHVIRVGRSEWVTPEQSSEHVTTHGSDTHRQIFIAIDDHLAAVATLAETTRRSAAAGVAKLEALGLKVEILTGDTAEHAANAGWPNAIANLSPEGKRRIVAQREAAGNLSLFVGDGLNDAPALASSFVSIALASGSGLANVAASATLFGDDLETLAWSIAFSRQSVWLVRRTILTAAAYNAVGMCVAAMGFLHPIMAAVLMVGSSLWVVSRVSKLDEDAPASPPIPRSGWVSDLTNGQPLLVESVESKSLVADFTDLSSSQVSASYVAIHALTFAAQGPLLAALSGASFQTGLDLTVLSVVLGVVAAWVWWRWVNMPHRFDMILGMMSVGNLGMLLGWWVGNGLRPVSGCECFSGSFSPGMWIGMVGFGHLAMIGSGRGRKNAQPTWFELIMGQLGMIVGMATGAIASEQMSLGVIGADFLMLVGMIAGMLVAHPAGAKCMSCVQGT